MSRRIVPIWLLVALTTGVPHAAAQAPYSNKLIPSRTSLARLGLERQWTAVVPLAGAGRLLRISFASGMIFAQTDTGELLTYESESGQLLWTASLGSATALARPASVNSTTVFVTSANLMFALDRESGRTMWRYDLGVLPSSATACDEKLAMVGLTNGKLVALRP